MASTDTSLTVGIEGRDETEPAFKSIGERFSGLRDVAMGAGAAVGAGFGASIAIAVERQDLAGVLRAKLGNPAAANTVGKAAGDAYTAGVGESLGELQDVAATVWNTGMLETGSSKELQSMVTQLEAVGTAFDLDVNDSAKAAAQMVRTGLVGSLQEAIDLIATGSRLGVDNSGDMLETINEYSVQFQKMGLSGKEAFGMMVQGLQAGAKDTDFVSDSLKEWVNIAQGGGKSVEAAYKSVGLSWDSIAKKVGEGGPATRDALIQVMDGLNSLEDPLKRDQAATAIFGSKSEDLRAALSALDVRGADALMGDTAGAANDMAKSMQTDGQIIESYKRQVEGTMAGIGAAIITHIKGHEKDLMGFIGVIAGLAVVVMAVTAATALWSASVAIANVITGIWVGIQWLLNLAFLANPITWIILGIIALIAIIVVIATKTTWFQTIWSWMCTAVSATWSWLVSAFSASVSWIGGIFSAIGSAIAGAFSAAWSAVVAGWNGFKGAIVAGVGALRSMFSSMFSPMWSGFRSAINAIIGGWNRLSFSIPSVDSHVPGVGRVGGMTISTPDIPYLAQGGIVTAPTLAVIGEAGSEAVIPLDRLPDGGGLTVHVHVGSVLGSARDIASAVDVALTRARAAGWRPSSTGVLAR